MFVTQLKLKTKIMLGVLFDTLFVILAWYLSYLIRYNFLIPDQLYTSAITALLVILPLMMLCYAYFGVHRTHWQFVSMTDLGRIMKSAITGTGVSGLILFGLTRLENIPRTSFLLFPLLLIAFWAGIRILYRYCREKINRPTLQKRALVIGAGQGGESLVRQLLHSDGHGYLPVAFVDDSRAMKGREIHGVRVVGTSNDIVQVCKDFNIDLIIIAIPSLDSKNIRRIVAQCVEAQVPYHTLPSLEDITSGKVSITQLRDLSLDDLLGRNEIKLDWESIHRMLKDEVILVTGGAGSIGSGLCYQIAESKPQKLIIVDNNEYNIYRLQNEFDSKFPGLDIRYCLVSVTDRAGIANILEQHKPKMVLHAAAFKHVPLLEFQVRSALMNNVLGTRIMAEESDKAGVDTFVLISTDKAVNPANMMGCSKRIAELFCQNFDRTSKTRFITVRFGNVLGSAGSVVPLFMKQLASGGPLTVTHPDITRYFMTIPEAAQLILQATLIGKGGEIFVLDMGEPIKINYLAEQMIRLSGFTPHDDIQIQYTGLRPGEKLYEELFHPSEMLVPTLHNKILLAQYREMSWNDLLSKLDWLEEKCEANLTEEDAQYLITELVPEHQCRTLLSAVEKDSVDNRSF